LDNDSLFNVFCLYRPIFLDEDDDDDERHHGGKEGKVRRRRWYKLAHVCQRWRDLLLASASYLDIYRVCTPGTPIADMLGHSLPLPLIIDYVCGDFDVSEEDEEGLLLALKQCDRVRLQMAVPNQEYDLETIRNTSSAASTTPRADWLRPSFKVSITHNRHGPCHTLTYSDRPIHLLPPKCFAPMVLIHALAGDTLDHLFIHCFRL
jgi:hypothetical protein